MPTAPSLKILVACHKPAALPANDIFVPVHCGRAVADCLSKDGRLDDAALAWLQTHCSGDDTGDNISALNRFLNEMTAVYWAWKNYDKLDSPDYIGLSHYRRYLALNGFRGLTRAQADCPHFLQDIQRFLPADPALFAYDAWIPAPSVCSEKTVRQYFIDVHGHAGLFDLYFAALQKQCPHAAQHISEYLNGTHHYLCNMFVMKKELFFNYAALQFAVWDQMKDHIFRAIEPHAGPKQQRLGAYLCERLTGAYLYHLKLTRKVIELPVLKLIYTDCLNEKEVAQARRNEEQKDRTLSRLCLHLSARYYFYKILAFLSPVLPIVRTRKETLHQRLRSVRTELTLRKKGRL